MASAGTHRSKRADAFSPGQRSTVGRGRVCRAYVLPILPDNGSILAMPPFPASVSEPSFPFASGIIRTRRLPLRGSVVSDWFARIARAICQFCPPQPVARRCDGVEMPTGYCGSSSDHSYGLARHSDPGRTDVPLAIDNHLDATPRLDIAGHMKGRISAGGLTFAGRESRPPLVLTVIPRPC
jgi:hypothetical protein